MNTQELLAALKAALPIVQRAAAVAPTTLTRQQRQREAAEVARRIQLLLAEEAR